MKNISGRELQNFVQKTMDDCFEEIDKGELWKFIVLDFYLLYV